jgi:metallophosphoesterase superfamily enzyme
MRVASHQSIPTPVRTEVQPGVWLDSRLAVWLPNERVLVVADLHWGYAASHRARGNLLPWWGDEEIEQRLRALLADYHPSEMIWLGDCVHAAEGGARAEAFLRQSPVPVVALAGNHDRRWRSAGGISALRGSYFFHHGDTSPARPPRSIEVIGHHHPSVSWGDGAGSRLKLPALVVGAQRIVLPAFSPWAAGTPWSTHQEPDETLWAVAPTRIFALPRNNSLSSVDAS